VKSALLFVFVIGLGVMLTAQGYSLRPFQPFTVSAAHTGDGIDKGGWFTLYLDGKAHSHVGLSAVGEDGYVRMPVPAGLSAGVHTAKIEACNQVGTTPTCHMSLSVKVCVRGENDPPCAPEWLVVTPDQ
jgi:hypothetical protein